MLKNTSAFFLAALALLAGGAAAHITNAVARRAPAPDVPLAARSFAERLGVYEARSQSYIAPAPANPLPGPAPAGAPALAAASAWRNPVRNALERLRSAWHDAPHTSRPAPDLVPC